MDEEIERVAKAIRFCHMDEPFRTEAWKNLASHDDHFGFNKQERETARKEAHAAIAAMSKPAEAATTWIKCSERMPEEGSLVLTCDEDDESSLLVRYYDGSEVDPSPWQPGPRGEWEAYREAITHWMPLPEPPKGTR